MTLLGESGYERKALDAYWTRPWVTQWLLNHVWGGGVPTDVTLWEPACGLGWMSKVLLSRGMDVLSTDVFDYGWDGMHGVQNFLDVEEVDPQVKIIFTNPPYDVEVESGFPRVTAEQFVRHAVKLMQPVQGDVFMLLRHEFDCASSRADLFEMGAYYAKYVLTKRPEWTDKSMPPVIDPKTGKPKKSGPRHNYSWYHWSWAPWTLGDRAEMHVLTGKSSCHG